MGLDLRDGVLYYEGTDIAPDLSVLPRHLRPHTAFGDDPSGYCGCADCEPSDDCACRTCREVT